MSAQKRRVREYDRNRKRMLRHKNKQPETIIMPCCSSLGSTGRPTVSGEHDVSLPNPTVLSKSAVKQRVFRLQAHMPNSLEKYAEIVSHMVVNATPTKSKALALKGLSGNQIKSKHKLNMYLSSMRENMKMLCRKKQHKWKVVKRCLALSFTSIRKAKNYKLISEHTEIDHRYLRKYASQEIDTIM